jgi:hypothetical protein
VQHGRLLPWLLAASIGLACSDAARPIELHGSVQKGPFVIGSSVSVSLLDSGLAPTGQVFNTQTSNDRGEFAIEFAASAPVALEGEGFYFNEVTGQLSQAALTLRAFYAPNGAADQRVFINMITHLTAERIKSLVAQGAAFAGAVTQAEDELRQQLQVTSDDYLPSVAGTSMDITGGDTRDNAYLLGVSSVLIQVAMASGASLDAELQQLLNGYSLDLADDGRLVQDRRADVAAALASLQVESIRENLANRLQELGSDDPIPEMRSVLDQTRCCQQGALFAGCRLSATMGLCDPGLACAQSAACGGPEPCCLPGGGLDQPCIERGCDSGLLCIPSIGASGSCGQHECCVAPTACSRPQDCGLGLTCSGSPEFCAGLARCCISPQHSGVGQPCGADAPCPEGLLCQVLMPGYDNTTQCDFDKRGTLGHPCRADGSCDQGFACTDLGPRGQTCQPHTGALGEECTGDSAIMTPTCDAGLVCTYGGSCSALESMSCCLPPGEVGDTCSEGTCGSGLACVRLGCPSHQEDCCAPAGGQDEPCLQDRSCDEGLVCEIVPPGASRCVGAGCDQQGCDLDSVCDPELNECVAPCSGPSDCSGGEVCDLESGLCVPPCSGPADCSGGEECDLESGVCERAPCTGPIDCPGGFVCDTAPGVCVPE